MLFCERSFGILFLIWGVILILDRIIITAQKGFLFAQLEAYMPGWCWGILLFSIGVGRWLAHRCHCSKWRIWLSLCTLIIMTIIATLAAWTGLWNATAPLAAFCAYVAWWCHRSLLRDIKGLDL